MHAAEVARAGAHVFHSSFWISLHERLRHQAVAKEPERHDFSADEQSAWDAAVAAYRNDVPKGSVPFNAELSGVAYALARTGDDEPKGLPPKVDAALRRAAPVYRARLWPDDDRANRFWIAVHGTMLREAGPEIVAGLEKTFGITWPKSLHIEVTPYADPFDAYSPAPLPDLKLSVISSRAADNQGFAGLDLLFHEPLHHFDEHIATFIPDEYLAHGILFYTPGELTRRALARRGVAYTPYAYTLGIYRRSYQPYIKRLETHWQAYLEGKLARDEAVRRIIEPAFELRSDFHVNLLQRLMGDVEGESPPNYDALSAEDRKIWESAVAEYSAAFKGKMAWLDRELSSLVVSVARGELPAKWRPLLDRAAPVYRKYWWTEDDAANRAWIEKARPLLDRYGKPLAAEHARVYGTAWPTVARIDLARYGGRLGAFTNWTPAGPQTVMSSIEPGYAGHASLEMVMHETSHQIVNPNGGTVGGPIQENAKRLGIPPPPQLWHAILFYTSGELTRRALAADGIAYEPMAYKGAFDGPMGAYVKSMETWWKPVLEGKGSRDEAIAKIVEEARPQPRTSLLAPKDDTVRSPVLSR